MAGIREAQRPETRDENPRRNRAKNPRKVAARTGVRGDGDLERVATKRRQEFFLRKRRKRSIGIHAPGFRACCVRVVGG